MVWTSTRRTLRWTSSIRWRRSPTLRFARALLEFGAHADMAAGAASRVTTTYRRLDAESRPARATLRVRHGGAGEQHLGAFGEAALAGAVAPDHQRSRAWRASSRVLGLRLAPGRFFEPTDAMAVIRLSYAV